MIMEFPLIVNDIRKSYKSHGKIVEAVRGISFNVRKNEIFGLLGPNGAGKTTTINMLSGILTPDSGSIQYFEKPLCEEAKSRINTATAYRSLSEHLTVYQNLNVFAKLYHVKDAKARINDLLKRFDVEDQRNQEIINLSSGQKTRVNLCKSLINNPDLLFLDEATAGLDPYMANVVRKEIKNLGKTIIFTSHIMSEVEELCNRIAFINQGKILKIDSPDEIKKLVRKNCLIIQFSPGKNIANVLKGYNILELKKDKVHIELDDSLQVQKILTKLMKNSIRINDIQVKKPSLDEVFIKIAKGEL
jgi:ABC-2 type transport system ATP-binding protein